MATLDRNGRIKLTHTEEALLFSDCNGVCPICGKTLLYDKNGKGRGFQAAHIYPHSPTAQQRIALSNVPMPKDVECIDNMILLCERCHNTQDFRTSEQDYLKLYNIKQAQLKHRIAQQVIAEINVEPQIDSILDALKNVTPEELIELKMTPVKVKEKVSDFPLRSKIVGYVTQYFNYVKSKLQDIDRTCSNRAEAIAKEIGLCFTKEKCANLFADQNIVFDAIVDWLASKTHGDRNACEIVIAYFVQDCEVFDAPAK